MTRARVTWGGVAVAVLAITWVVAASTTAALPDWEATLTRQVNGWPAGLRSVLYPVMQLGTVWMAVVLPLVLLVWQRRLRAVAVGVAAPLAAWALAKVVKELVGRGRPGDLMPDVVVRETGVHGYGYPSGHAAVAFACATVVAAYLPARWRWAPFVVATVTALARVYDGAHLPLDVVGGAALGVLCGLAALALLREPPRSTARP